MRAASFRRADCRLCGGRDLELVVPLKATPIADAYVSAGMLNKTQETYSLDLFWCRGCSHLQLLDVVNPVALFADYIYRTSDSLGLVEHFRRYADEALRAVNPPKGGLVVDIGSNDGTLLRFFHERGMRVLGVDPARDIARQATESGVQTLPIFFSAELARKIRDDFGPAAVVTANNVFAHSDNLADIAEGIRELLAPDGVFVFEVSYLVDVIQNTLLDTIYHEHLCYHSVEPLEAFFRRHGMELIDARRVATKGGSLRGMAQVADGPRKASPSVAGLIALEKSLGFDRPEPFKSFAARLAAAQNHLADLARGLKAAGKTIMGYGASAGVTTLIYQLGLGGVLDLLVDDNPLRHHLFSPGYHIPVLSPREIYERKADYVLMLAWQYSRPIMEKHQAFLERGGHYILPLPEVKVI